LFEENPLSEEVALFQIVLCTQLEAPLRLEFRHQIGWNWEKIGYASRSLNSFLSGDFGFLLNNSSGSLNLSDAWRLWHLARSYGDLCLLFVRDRSTLNF